MQQPKFYGAAARNVPASLTPTIDETPSGAGAGGESGGTTTAAANGGYVGGGRREGGVTSWVQARVVRINTVLADHGAVQCSSFNDHCIA
jgi:hypothetical protein